MRQKKTTIAKMSVVRECSSKSVALVLSRCCWALHLPSRRRLKRGSEGNPVYTSISPHKILHVDIERKSLHALTTLLRQGFQEDTLLFVWRKTKVHDNGSKFSRRKKNDTGEGRVYERVRVKPLKASWSPSDSDSGSTAITGRLPR